MRATVHTLITTAPAIVAIIPPERWYQAGAVVDTPVKPFGVLRWLAPVPLAAGFARQLRVDVHDVRGSYSRIEAVLGSKDRNDGVYAVLAPLQQYVGVDGRISQCDFLGLGGDQEDETYGTNYSFSSWQVIGVDL